MSLNRHETELPSFPIRFGILDSVAALVLFGIHLGVFKFLLIGRNTVQGEVDAERLTAAALLCAAFAFGAAYLAFRFATSKKIANYRWRLLSLLAFDAGLLLVPLLLYVANNVKHGVGVAFALILLVVLFWILVQRSGQN